MEAINILYQRLETIDTKDFYQIESDFFMKLYKISGEKQHPAITAFLTISTWYGSCLRSGVWTFYEVADMKAVYITLEYLRQAGQNEWAVIFESGIHDYQNPQYAGNYDYPESWIEESGAIDNWIWRNEEKIIDWERRVLLENREMICSLFAG